MQRRDLALLMAAGAAMQLLAVAREATTKAGREETSATQRAAATTWRRHLAEAAQRSLSYGALYLGHGVGAWLVRALGLRRWRALAAALCSAAAQLALSSP